MSTVSWTSNCLYSHFLNCLWMDVCVDEWCQLETHEVVNIMKEFWLEHASKRLACRRDFIVTFSLIRYYNFVIFKKSSIIDFAQLYHIYSMYMLNKIIDKTYEPWILNVINFLLIMNCQFVTKSKLWLKLKCLTNHCFSLL